MANIGPKFDNTGIVLALDAGNSKSYDPRNPGSNWNDAFGTGGVSRLQNAPTWSNKSFVFDGTNDHIDYDREDLNGGSFAYSEITLYMWFKPVTTGYNARTNGKANLITIENVLEISVSDNGDGTGELQFKPNTDSWSGTSSSALTNGSWNMITYVHTTTSRELYVNASSVLSSTDTGGLGSGNSSYPYVNFMAKRRGRNSVTPGELAKVKMFSKPHTDLEIQRRYRIKDSRFT